jgi:DNA-binding transcriptional regulator of glucitol operon
VRRVLLSPRWLLGHLLTLAAAVVCVRLGWWQWHRAQQTGSLQNLGYAIQWPVFGLFALALWGRVIRDQVRPPRQAPRSTPIRRPRPAAPAATAEQLPLAPDDPADAELIAYNRYLASLAERDAQDERDRKAP